LRSTTFWLLLSLGAAIAVLAWSARQPLRLASTVGDAPPVRAVDAPPPDAVAGLLDAELGVVQSGGGISVTLDAVCTPSPCTARDVRRMKAQVAEHRDRIRPAPGTSPRTVAELHGKDLLIAWRNRASQLCLEATRVQGGGTPVFGPCVGDDRADPCTALCLVSSSTGDRSSVRYLLAGTVSGDATALRITTARTRTTYPLQGPVLAGTNRRVFMLELGHDDYRVLELLRGASVVDSRSLPVWQAAVEDCQASVQGMNDLKACFQRAAPTMADLSFP
jgi:hypothetical protein